MAETGGKKFEDFLQKRLKEFQAAEEAESSSRTKCLDDLRFSTGDQWDQNIRSRRERKNKPCLTMDQLQQSVRIVCNEYRQQRPSIEVNPVGDDADIDTAEILQGLVRHVEVNSDAEVAYDGAHESVVRIGFGSWRLLSDYADDETDEQEIFIEPIRNHFSVYWQPGVPQHKAKYCFITADIPRETYLADYSESQLSLTNFTGIGDVPSEWITKEDVRVAEYFEVTEETVKDKKRPVRKVKWYKFNAIELLNEHKEDGEPQPGTSIPVFTAYGDDIDVDGERYLAGLVRNGKDPQRFRNYTVSKAAETVALAPDAPWLVPEGGIAGYENIWANANTGDVTVLPYKLIDVAGKPAPAPQRNSVEPPIQAIQQLTAQAGLDLKAALGIYDPSLGQRKGDESGKAIERLQTQGAVSTFNYSDNVARTMRRFGRVLLQWIRDKYDVPRVRRIIKPDGSVSQIVTHNGADQKAAAEGLLTEKIKKAYDIGSGRYDVVIAVGPSYQTRRQESVATQLDFLKSLPPQLAMNVMDLITGNMDWPQAKEFAARFKRMIPPQILGGDENDPETQVQQLQAQLKQAMQQHDLMAKANQELLQAHQTKQVEQQGKVQIVQIQEETKRSIAQMQEATKLSVAQLNASKDVNQSFAESEIKTYQLLHGDAHDAEMQANQQQHEKDMAAQQQAAAAAGQQADQSHDADMAASGQQHESEMAAANQGAE